MEGEREAEEGKGREETEGAEDQGYAILDGVPREGGL